jgi:hypothetical protein
MTLARTRSLLYVLSLISVFMTVHQACAAETGGSGFIGDGFFQPKFELNLSAPNFADPWQEGKVQSVMDLDWEAVLGRYELSNTAHVDLDAGIQQGASAFHASLSHGVKMKIKLSY